MALTNLLCIIVLYFHVHLSSILLTEREKFTFHNMHTSSIDHTYNLVHKVYH
jgi:hypothetical protein